ncbi:MAG: methyltransferase domain-containing protein [Wenzhouxiangella sp.]|nr:MAG: methyltransferase domain-containing protein [Wenzhouxiangella sp.]
MKLSIGAGERRLPGWVHLDIDPATRPDILADISQPLPFPDRSIECVLCEEVITQIPLDAGQRFLAECRRILQPDGVIRISTPDLARLAQAYLQRPDWLLEIWEEQVGLPLQTGTAAEVLNTGLRAVGPFVYDEPTLRIVAERAGFRMQRREVNESCHPHLRDIDLRSPERTVSMYLELTLPASG